NWSLRLQQRHHLEHPTRLEVGSQRGRVDTAIASAEVAPTVPRSLDGTDAQHELAIDGLGVHHRRLDGGRADPLPADGHVLARAVETEVEVGAMKVEAV